MLDTRSLIQAADLWSLYVCHRKNPHLTSGFVVLHYGYDAELEPSLLGLHLC